MCESLCSKEMLNGMPLQYKQIGENKQIGEKLAAFVDCIGCLPETLSFPESF